MTWKLAYTKQAQKDARKLASSGLKPKAQELLALITEDPYRKPPPFEKLIGDLGVIVKSGVQGKSSGGLV